MAQRGTGMTDAQKSLLSLLAKAIFDTPTNVVVTSEILDEAKSQTVNSIITNDYNTIAQNIRVINAHAELTKIMEGIPFATFKGYASAYYYKQPVYRPMGDVDFITYSDRYDETVERLLAAGWERMNSSHERHVSFRKGKVELELHTEIKGVPNGKDGIVTTSKTAGAKVRALLEDLISTARVVNTQHGNIIIPDDFHHGLIMLLHVASHIINDGGIGLRHICDWATYVYRVDVNKFKPQFESVGLWSFACQLTSVCSKYLGLPKMDWSGNQDNAFLEGFIEDVLASGNFGNKEAGRRAALVLHRSSFAEMTKNRYPQASGLHLPIYMVRNALRYGLLTIAGKRRLIKPSTFTQAKTRDNLYKQFRLFECEENDE